MATAIWPRELWPTDATLPIQPSGYVSFSPSGRAQSADSGQLGRQWSETFPPHYHTNPAARRLHALANHAWRSKERYLVQHSNYLARFGTLKGEVMVTGWNQVGSLLSTTERNGTLLAGSQILIGSNTLVYEVVTDANSGNGPIRISPPILLGGSPRDRDAVVYTGVRFTCILVEMVMPNFRPGSIVGSLKLTWREVL